MSKEIPDFDTMRNALRMLEVDEGRVPTPYKDSLGFWTIGIGRYIGPALTELKLSNRIIEEMLREDVEVAWTSVIKIFGADRVCKWTNGRRLALLNLLFNLGETRFLKFAPTIALMKEGRWEEAATRLERSLWYKQVGKRALRVVQMIRTGGVHERYSLGS